MMAKHYAIMHDTGEIIAEGEGYLATSNEPWRITNSIATPGGKE